MKRLLFCDPYIVGNGGHYLPYAQGFRWEVNSRGIPCFVVGNKRSQHIGESVVIAHFTSDTNAQTSLIQWKNSRSRRRSILQDLKSLFARLDISSRDHVVFNSLQHWDLVAVVDWMEQIPGALQPRLSIILHFTSEITPKSQGQRVASKNYREFFRRIRTSALRSRFFLYADSEELRREFGVLGADYIQVIPAPALGARTEPLIQVQDAMKTAPHVVYLGAAETRKGFHLLPALVAGIFREVQAGTVKFTVMTGGRTTFVREQRTLRRMNVDLIERPLNDHEYASLLSSSTIALLPYIGQLYKSQTSGCWTESAATGAIPVVATGTWLEQQNHHWGVGSAFDPQNGQQLTDAIKTVLADYSRLRKQSIARAPLILSALSFSRIVDTILGDSS